MNAQRFQDLSPEFSTRVLHDVPMSKHTSWHVGGPADLFFTPRDVMDLAAFMRQLPPDVPLLWVGLGSNLLVRDGGVRGAVISTHGALGALERLSATPIHAEAGRAVRAHRAAMREVGLGAGGILCRHSGDPRRRAGHECRRLGRRDLAACGRGRGARSPRHAPHAHPRRLRDRLPPRTGPANEWFIAARLRVRAQARRQYRRHPRTAGEAQGERSPSASGAAVRCSPIRRAIMRRG